LEKAINALYQNIICTNVDNKQKLLVGKAPIQNLQGEVRTLSPTPIDTYVCYIN